MPGRLQAGQETQDEVRWRVRNRFGMNRRIGWQCVLFVMALALSGSMLAARPALDARERCLFASPLTGEADTGRNHPQAELLNLPKVNLCRKQDGQIQAGGGCICCYPNRVCACTFVNECGQTGGVCTGPC
jgi:hypothetical protein